MTEPQPQYDATKRKLKSLTRRQEALHRFLIGYKLKSGGDSPTYDEIMHAVGITSKSVVRHNLIALDRRGLITLTPTPNGRTRRVLRLAVTGGRWVYEPPSEATP